MMFFFKMEAHGGGGSIIGTTSHHGQIRVRSLKNFASTVQEIHMEIAKFDEVIQLWGSES